MGLPGLYPSLTLILLAESKDKLRPIPFSSFHFNKQIPLLERKRFFNADYSCCFIGFQFELRCDTGIQISRVFQLYALSDLCLLHPIPPLLHIFNNPIFA